MNRKKNRAIVTVPLGAVLGTLIPSLPVFGRLIAASINRDGDGQLGLGLVLLLTVAGSIGMVSGIIGGFIRSSQQPFFIAASPCLGVLLGTVLAIVRFDIFFVLLAPTVGCVLGCLFAVLTWQRRSQ